MKPGGAYRPGNRHRGRRQAPWRHDHTTEHINSPGTLVRGPRPSTGQPMGGAARRARRHVHGRAGLLHRQRRAAVDPGRAACQRRRDRMGRGRLRADFGGVPDRRRTARATDRPPAHVRAGADRVHALLGGLRRRRQPGDPGVGAAGPGNRRGAADAKRAGDHRRDLRGPRPGQGARRLWAGDGSCGGQRPADRRSADPGRYRRPRLAQLLSDQRADRPDRGDPGAAGRAGVALGAGQPARSRRDGAAHRRVDRGGAAARRGTPARLATVDLGVARDRAADPGRLRRPPAAPGRPGR